MCFCLIIFALIKAPMLATFSDLPVACMGALISARTLSDHDEKVDVTHEVSLDDFWH